MRYEYAYELISAVFLAVIAWSYQKKNWLMLRVNRVFNVVLWLSVVVNVLDILIHCLQRRQVWFMINELAGLCSGLGIAAVLLGLLAYIMALTERLYLIVDKILWLFLAPALLVILMLLFSPWNYILLYYDNEGGVCFGRGAGFAMLVAVGYFLVAVRIIWRSEQIAGKGRKLSLIILDSLPVIAILLQYRYFQGRYLLLYYPVAYFLVYCYLFYQNMEQFSDRISGGFSRAGFRKVVRERCLYQQDFSCLSINIRNYSNIKNICDEEGIDHVMGAIGSILREQGGRHNQFHIHGAEFIVMQKNSRDTVRLFQTLQEELPATMRIQNRTVVLNYGFYMLTFEEAAYDQGNFYKILSSMRRQLRQQADQSRLIRYEGQVKEIVDRELCVGRKMKNIMTTRVNELRFMPLQNVHTGCLDSVESFLYMSGENGEGIDMESIFDMAKDMGCITALGSVIFENTLRFVQETQLLEKGIRRIHINVLPSQICSDALVQEYIETAGRYRISPESICLEITEDTSVPTEVLHHYVERLKEAGFYLVLDQYGVNVCNLQSTMNMPFHMVKVNHDLINRYCTERSLTLEYQVRMLRRSGFHICLDGIDNSEKRQKVAHLQPDYMQGYLYSPPMSGDKLISWLMDSNVSERKSIYCGG